MPEYQLPISGLRVIVRQPTGVEDLLLQEARDLDLVLAFQLFDCLVRAPHDATANWSELAVTDLEALLLLLRRATLGDSIRAEANCAAVGCEARVDVSFHVDEYLASQKPRIPRGVEKINGDGSYRLAGDPVTFRLPNGGDLVAINRQADGEQELIRRCVQPANVRARVRQRIDRAMQALAPRLSRMLTGECPECHATMNFYFDVHQFVLRELRDHAATVYDDVHLLAFYYKWPEEDILALPRSRRAHYAEALRGQGSAA